MNEEECDRMSEETAKATQRLIYHPGRVAAWLDGKKIYPLETEMELSDAVDIDVRIIKQTLAQLARKGLKSITFLGDVASAALKTKYAEREKIVKSLGLVCRLKMKPNNEASVEITSDTDLTDNGKVVAKSQVAKPFTECYALPFAVYITANGDVYPAACVVGNEDYKYGNICEQDIIEICESKQAQKTVKKIVANDFFVAHCQHKCRRDAMNQYLHELKHPGAHVNFI